MLTLQCIQVLLLKAGMWIDKAKNREMKRIVWMVFWSVCYSNAYCWGFFGHRHINYHAVFLLPPGMLVFFKKNIDFLTDHAVDPDKRRYAFAPEAPRHYIDMDRYGQFPFDSIPRKWKAAVDKFGEDSLNAHGIGPWWVNIMLARLTKAFELKDRFLILRYAAELGHYVADLHVPLHTSSNHNGQFTGQKGIHGFWESRIPELFAEKHWDFLIAPAIYIEDPLQFIWNRVLESAAASDSVLKLERELSGKFPLELKYSFEERNGIIIKQYSSIYTSKYNSLLNDMVERRMRRSIHSVASYWYTAWANAGQPDLSSIMDRQLTEEELKELDTLNQQWKMGVSGGKLCDEEGPG